MKAAMKFLGIAALTAVMGFTMAGCPDPGSENGPGGAPCTHQWEWKVSTPATLTEDGEETETCSICDETKGEPRPVLSLKSILEAASGGDSADDPVSVALKLDLGDMAQAGSNWLGLLAALNEAGKYVALDLSACTLTGTEFNTGVTSSSKPDGMDYIVSIVLPDSVTTIGMSAFRDCSSLTSVTIPDSVTTIGMSAFRDCSSLTSVTIGDNVTSIGTYAFYYCSSLTSVTIGDNVTSIGSQAFWGCSSLTSVTIGDNVTSIGSYAFRACSNLTSITIPDSVTAIGFQAFVLCTSLESITIGGNVTLGTENLFDTVYNNTCGKAPGTYTRENGSSKEWTWKGGNGEGFIVAFHSMGGSYINAHTGLQSGANVNAPTAPTKEGYTFGAWYTDFDCTTAASFPMTVTADTILYAGWVYNETPLYTWLMEQSGGGSADNPVAIPKEQLETDLGDMTQAGSNWNKLLLNLAESGKYVSLDLSGCTLTGTTFNTGLTNISKPYGMDNIVSIILPNSVTSIGYGAFWGCTGLTSIDIPDSVTSIGNYVFYGCTSLESVTIPAGVTTIGDSAFYGCTSLASVTIPDSVTSIGSYVFRDCKSLASVIIGDSVESISYGAFWGCTGLTSVTCLAEEPPALGTIVFSNTASALAIKVPAGSVEAYKAAWSDYAERISAIE